MVASVIERSEVNQADLNSVLNPKHQRELVHKRGLNPDWVLANCKSVDAKTASEHLGYPALSPCILFSGHGYQEQVRPDTPWLSEDGKRPKYRSCKDEDGYDAYLTRHPKDPRYWDDLEALKSKCYQIDGNPCLVLVEGVCKAISLNSHGVPTVAILGVEQGLTSGKRDPQGRRYLVPGLERFEKEGFGFIIGFDADGVRKKGVIMAEYSLGFQLLLFNSPLYSITGLWHEQHESGKSQKGIDDHIQLNGYEKFNREVLSKAETFDQWKEKHLDVLERQFNQGSKTKPPTPRETSKEIAEDYQDWKYDNENKTWRHWAGKYWKAVDGKVFRSTIKTDIDGRGVNYAKAEYISNVVSLIEDDLRVPKWKTLDRYKHIPFNNGVLEVATGKLRDHNPDDGLTYVLPHNYQPMVVNQLEDALRENCPHTYKYLVSSQQGNWAMIKKMLAVVNGVVTGKLSRLQMFVHLSGKSRSGKGTFTRLLKECVGEENHKAAKLEELSDKETRAQAINKMLIECAEQRGTTSEKDISWLLALTGRDSMNCKHLYTGSFSATFNGAIVITSNRSAGTTKYQELEERLCLIPFLHEIPKQNRLENLDELIQSEISQLLAIALGMSNQEVVNLLRGQGEGENPVVKLHQWESTTDDSIVAAFFNDKLIVETGESTTTKELYRYFESYCDDEGKHPLAKNKFSRELNDLCTRLGLKVNWNKTANYPRFEGLRLRKSYDDHPTYVQVLSQKVTSQTNERPLGCSLETKIEATESNVQKAIETKETKIETTSSFSSEFKNSHEQNQVSDRSSQPENPPEIESQFKVGDMVIRLKDGRKGKVIGVDPTRSQSLLIRLDNSITTWERPEHLELVPPKKPEPKPQKEPQLKPALADDFTPGRKENYLYDNQGAEKPVWVKTDDYEGEAILKGKNKNGEGWRVSIPGRFEYEFVSTDQIEVLDSQRGKYKRLPKPPEGDQIELNLDTCEKLSDIDNPSEK